MGPFRFAVVSSVALLVVTCAGRSVQRNDPEQSAGQPSGNDTGGHAGAASGTRGESVGGTMGGEAGLGGAAGSPSVPGTCPGIPSDALVPDDYCYVPEVGAASPPSTLFLVIDRSAAVGEPLRNGEKRLHALRRAIENLVALEPPWLVHAGNNFFPLSGGLDPGADCDATYYSTWPVFGAVSEVGPDILTGLERVSTDGEPTLLPALEAALTSLREWRTSRLDQVRLIIVTDGAPTPCGAHGAAEAVLALVEQTTDIEVAAVSYSPDADLSELVGSERAGWLNPDDPVTTFFPQRGTGCRFDYPTHLEDQSVTPSVALSFANGSVERLAGLRSDADCTESANGGFYLDASAGELELVLCPCSCGRARLAERVQPLYACERLPGAR